MAITGARTSPAIKAIRQPLSFTPKPRQPPNMPLMPAPPPGNNINSVAERPISTPPIAAETGIKFAMSFPSHVGHAGLALGHVPFILCAAAANDARRVLGQRTSDPPAFFQ